MIRFFIHIFLERLVLKLDDNDLYQNALFRLLGVISQLETEIIQQRRESPSDSRRMIIIMVNRRSDLRRRMDG